MDADDCRADFDDGIGMDIKKEEQEIPAINLQDISFGYPDSDRNILDCLTFSFNSGERLEFWLQTDQEKPRYSI